MAQQQISAGVRQIWHSAGDIALAAGAAEIEPVHFLYGILHFAGKSTATGESVPDTSESKERHRIISLISDARVGLDQVRNALQVFIQPSGSSRDTNISTSVRMTRSAESKAIFAAASNAADGREVDAMDLFVALCKSGDERILRLLGDSAERVIVLTSPEIDRGGVGMLGEAGAAQQAAPSHSAASEPAPAHTAPASPTAQTGHTPAATAAAPMPVKDSPAELTVLQQCDVSMMVKAPGARVENPDFISLCELSWEAGTSASSEQMLQTVLDGLMNLVPADRGAILVLDKPTGQWMLKTHSGGSTPRLSMTSVQKAVDRRIGFIWKKGEDMSNSMSDCSVEEGMYVPILADGEVFGVVCLDSSSQARSFLSSDLRAVTALAHQIGLFIAHQEMRKQLTSNMRAMERLLTSFSPRVRTRLVQRVRQGKLQLGGERAVVTIVFVDIRGFTKLSTTMDPEDLTELLNAYFSALSDCVIRNEGTINDFVGDALVAVFGSPEPDPKHCHHGLVTAVEMQAAVAKLTEERIACSQVTCKVGVGVHSGEVLHGFIGSNDCMQYTVVGDVVNLASRYSTGAHSGTILVSPQVHALVWAEVEAEKVTIPTKHEGDMTAYRIEKLRFR